MATLRLQIPPVVVMSFFGALMWLLTRVTRTLEVDLPLRWIIAIGFLLAAVVVCVAGVMTFRIAKTTVNPRHPQNTSALVTTGIYRMTRNPMYLGMLLLLVALAAALANPVSLAGPVGFVFYMNRYQIAPEETVLTNLFGETYQSYCRSVRRWI